MTSKEKAEELFYNFNKKGLFQISEIINSNIRKSIIKQCALIAVEEILNLLETLVKPEYTQFITKQAVFIDGGLSEEPETYDGYELIEFYEQVKKEIEAL